MGNLEEEDMWRRAMGKSDSEDLKTWKKHFPTGVLDAEEESYLSWAESQDDSDDDD